MQGASVKAVQELLGHSSLEVTMKYAHLSPGYRQDVVEKLRFGEESPENGHQSGHQAKEPEKTFAVSA